MPPSREESAASGWFMCRYYKCPAHQPNLEQVWKPSLASESPTDWGLLYEFPFFFFFFLFFLGPTLGIWKFQAWGWIRTAAAGLHHSSQQRRILNPLSKVREMNLSPHGYKSGLLLLSHNGGSLSFLLLAITNYFNSWVSNNTNLLSYSSGGRKSGMDLTGVKFRCQQSCITSGGSWGRIRSFTFSTF